MRFRHILAIAAAVSAVSAPAATAKKKPLAVKAPASLAVYAGKYPFDKVGGVDFLAHPLVRAGVAKAVADPIIRQFVLGRTGPASPIALTAGRVLASGCEQHNCGDHGWSLLIGEKGDKPEVCIRDVAAWGEKSRWYAPGVAPQLRNDPCPQA